MASKVIAVCLTLPLLGLAASPGDYDARNASLLWSEKSGFNIVDDYISSPQTVAWAHYEPVFQGDVYMGWGSFEVDTFDTFDDHTQAYGAGYIEGYISASQIYDAWRNNDVEHYCDGKDMELVCPKIRQFVNANNDWVKKQVNINCPDPTKDFCDPYWHHVGLVYAQIQGMEDGYTVQANDGKVPSIPQGDIFFMNIIMDMDELSQAMAYQYDLKVDLNQIPGGAASGAFVKFVPNGDIVAGHTTGAGYQRMLRQYKKYTLNFKQTLDGKDDVMPGKQIVQTGYPAQIASGDNYHFIHPSYLLTMDTVITNYNQLLWKHVSPTGSIFTSIRTIVANRLSNNGKEWSKTFSKFNSGTDNREWMIVKYGVNFTDKNVFWVLDQVPGTTFQADLTHKMRANNSYFASYNIPYFSEAFQINGGQENVEKYGDFFSHEKSPIGQQYKKLNNPNIKEAYDLYGVIDYNFYNTDELSKCDDCIPTQNAAIAPSPRSDLNPADGSYPFDALSHRCHGAIDYKVVSFELFRELSLLSSSGPTFNFDGTSIFQWDNSDCSYLPHYGMVNKYNYAPNFCEWQIPDVI